MGSQDMNDEEMKEIQDKASVLIEALPYIREFNRKIIVVKYGGSAMSDEAIKESVIKDVTLLKLVGFKPVIVHGGGKAISRALKESGLEPRFLAGLRVTDEQTMEIVRRTLNNVVNRDLVRRLQAMQTNARPLHGNWMFRVKKVMKLDPTTGEALDHGYVGEPVGVDTRAVVEMLEAGIVPVVTPIGTGVDDDHLYNVNADSAAAMLAKALKVRKFAVISDVPGLLRDPADPSTLLATLRLGSIEKLKKDGTISGGMLPKIAGCVAALQAGINKVHLIDGRIKHSLLLEIFTGNGVGTQIVRPDSVM